MDEPTAALTSTEVEILVRLVKRLKERGMALIFISHRLKEVFDIAEEVTVLKDGRLVETTAIRTVQPTDVIRMMVRRDLDHYFPPLAQPEEVGQVILRVSGASNAALREINLELRAGEVVGVAGLQGSGRTALAHSLFGVTPFTTGNMEVNGTAAPVRSPDQAIKRSMGFVTEDRKAEGILPNQPLRDNILVTVRALQSLLARARRNGVAGRPDLVPRLAQEVDVRASGYGQEVQYLSGGNQQKVILAKWLASTSRVMIFDEPTRGIDVEAKASIHDMIRDLARNGTAVLMISSELPEIIGMSDRIVVMWDGTIVGELPPIPAKRRSCCWRPGIKTAMRPRLKTPGRLRSKLPRPSRRPAGRLPARRKGTVVRHDNHYTFERPETHPGQPHPAGLRHPAGGLPGRHHFGYGFRPRADDFPTILSNILVRSVALGIVAIGQTFVMIGASIDLSVAYTISVTAVMSSFLMQGDPARVPMTIAAVLLIGVVIGLANGLVITKLRVNAFIATLGTGLIMKGLLNAAFSNFAGSVPASFQTFGYGTIGPVPISVLILLAVGVAGWFILSRTTYGAHLYGVGGNTEVARLSGLRTDRVIIVAHIICSLTAVMTGLFVVSRLRSGAPWVGPDGLYDLESIAAVVVGGTALSGGRGGVAGTIAGVLIFGILDTLFNQLGVDTFLKQVLRGAIIILAVASYTIRSRREAA